MKSNGKFLVGAILLASILKGSAQPTNTLSLAWQHSFGGTANDLLATVFETADGSYIVAGTSPSGTDGNKTSPNYGGSSDFWLVRFDESHTIWDRSYGSSNYEALVDALEGDPGFFLAGTANSGATDGVRTSPGFGASDFWVVGTDGSGDAKWDVTFGGSNSDTLSAMAVGTENSARVPRGAAATSYGVVQGHMRVVFHGVPGFTYAVEYSSNLVKWSLSSTMKADTNGDFVFVEPGPADQAMRFYRGLPEIVLGGTSYSGISGSKKAPNLGLDDFWVVTMDSLGNQLWDRTFGGAMEDELSSVQRTLDGGIIVGGTSYSQADANKSSPHFGGGDYWIVRLNAEGDKLWDRSFGGSNSDMLKRVLQMRDGGFLLVGISASGVEGNKETPNLGGADVWVVRTDQGGNKLWETSIGSASTDVAADAQETPDGGVLIGGYRQARLGPGAQFRLSRLAADGTLAWEQVFDGTGSDPIASVRRTSDGGFLLGGSSDSPEGLDKTVPNYGLYDFWVIKTTPETLKQAEVGTPRLRKVQ